MLQELLSEIEDDYEGFYGELVSIEQVRDTELHCLCPVHGDSNPSLHINKETGAWHCKTCGEGGGVIQFIEFLYEVDTKDAIDLLEVQMKKKPVPLFNVDTAHKNLLSEDFAYISLQSMGISKEIIKKYRVGWQNGRYCFPIYDKGGNLRNVRMHSPEKTAQKVISIKGFGEVRLFPIEQLIHNKLYIFEGEKDTLVALSQGLNAITSTGGAGNWDIGFNRYFKDKEVIICYDIDEAGRKGAKKTASFLLEVARRVEILSLPEDGLPDNGDFTDYIKLKGIEEFKKLVPKLAKKEDFDDEDLLYEAHLGDTTNSFYYNKRVKTKGIITGKGGLYMCPSKVGFKCKMDQEDKCGYCWLKASGGVAEKLLAKDSKVMLKLIKIPEEKQAAIIKEHFRLPVKCPGIRMSVLDVINIEEMAVIPEIDYDNFSSNSYISREVYNISDKTLDSNKPYILEGRVLPHPLTQESTIINYSSESTKDHIDMFEMTPELHERLKVFQADGWEAMQNKLKEKYNDYEVITGIFKRHALFVATDIVYHSVLNFKFQNKIVKRGHVNALIFGDTRTGKSETVDSLIAHFKAGEAVGGENLSFAGLVGGVHKVGSGDKWGITWKAIPLNDRRLVKIDEFHEMSPEDIRKMSELMSSGVAVIQKIHNERTMARTRLILLANCRGGQNLSYFQFGCQAIPAIMGDKNEDIARLDFAMAVKASDVDLEHLNELKSHKRQIKTFSSDLCNSLIMWAWSRKANQVVITEEAESLILTESIRQAKEYHMSIPLVPTAEHPIKLARMACAIAAMFYSTDDDGERVIVKREHAQFAIKFLDKIYTNDNMGFQLYSKQMCVKDEIKDVKELERIGITKSIKDMLLQFDKINANNLEAIFNKADNQSGKFLLHYLLRNNAIRPEKHYYIKTPAFIKFLMDTEFPEETTSTGSFI